MINLNNIRAIAFDADDTLWDCQSHFETVENHLYRLIAPYCEVPAKELFQTESDNMTDLGYGCKAFTISIIETALRVAGDHLSATELADLLNDCKSLLHLPATPLPEVEETLQRLQAYPYRLIVFTKGELQDQENKLKRSGSRGNHVRQDRDGVPTALSASRHPALPTADGGQLAKERHRPSPRCRCFSHPYPFPCHVATGTF